MRVGGHRPVLMMHFPLYRKSDERCEELDSAFGNEKKKAFIPKIDCVSRASTKLLLETLNPRLVLDGHTHNGCVLKNKKYDLEEWTVASFNWRNRPDPSFLLARISHTNHTITKCFLPHEYKVITTYVISLLCFLYYI